MSWFLTPIEQEALALSLRIAAVSVVASLPPAVFVAWLLARTRFWGKIVLDAVVHLPLVLPPVVVGYALLLLFGRRGVLGQWLHESLGISIAFTWKGAALAAAVMAFPIVVRAIRISIEAIDPGLETAARTLGAGRARVFTTVTLPLMLPGLLAGAVLGFARALGEFGATITFVSNIPGETRTLPIAVYTLLQTPGADTSVLRLALISVVLAVGAVIASEILGRRVQARIRGVF